MAKFNYIAAQKTALRLINKFGFVTTIGRVSGTYNAVEGTTSGSATQTTPATVVSLPFSQGSSRGFDNDFIEDLKKSKGRFFYVAAKDLIFQAEAGDVLLFENTVWDVSGTTPLNPAGTPLIFTLGCKLSTKSITLFD